MGPTGGRQVGWDQVLAIWKKQADKRLGGKVKPEKLRIHVGSDLAIVSCFEVGENVVDGKPQEVSIRATNIFRKENGRWKMIGHHTDLLAFLKE
jgi:ketosteroid isomerase-like protein